MQSRDTMLAGRKAAIEDVVKAANGIVAEYAQMAERNELTQAQAQQQAMKQLSAMRFPGNGYMIVTTAQPVVIMHPVLADLRNKDVSTYADPDGKLLFVEMVIPVHIAYPANRHLASKVRVFVEWAIELLRASEPA